MRTQYSTKAWLSVTAAARSARSWRISGLLRLQRRSEGFDDDAAADGADRRERSDDEAVGGAGDDRLGEVELDDALLAGDDGVAGGQVGGGHHLARAGVELHLRGVLEKEALVRQEAKAGRCTTPRRRSSRGRSGRCRGR